MAAQTRTARLLEAGVAAEILFFAVTLAEIFARPGNEGGLHRLGAARARLYAPAPPRVETDAGPALVALYGMMGGPSA